jgi:hypothetical protein
MASLVVVFWWVVFGLARLALNAWVLVAWFPGLVLRHLGRARDAAEIEWLCAKTRRRIAQRKRWAQSDQGVR